MYPTSFDQANHVFDKPEGTSYDKCEALDTFVGHTPEGEAIVISCWKLTLEELEEINRTGRVWCFHFGAALQPHSLSGTNPFES